MENVWEVTGALAGGPSGEGWEDWLGHVLVPIAVLIFLSNVSSMRMMLGLRGQTGSWTTTPRLTSLFMGPVILYGISHVVTVYAARHPEFRAFALALETVTAVSWVFAVSRFSRFLVGPIEPIEKPSFVPAPTSVGGRGLAALSASASYPRPPSATNGP